MLTSHAAIASTLPCRVAPLSRGGARVLHALQLQYVPVWDLPSERSPRHWTSVQLCGGAHGRGHGCLQEALDVYALRRSMPRLPPAVSDAAYVRV